MTNTIENEYFDWLCHIVCGDDRFRLKSYYELLSVLHDIDFIWIIHNDENRADEGICLRSRFALAMDYDQEEVDLSISYPCSVLEMMIALAIRCEENIMANPQIGDRTTQWFWGMIRSLTLMSMHDTYFNRCIVEDVVDNFLSRKYARNGEGGLFTIKNCETDLRNVEIWHQLCWYLDTITGY